MSSELDLTKTEPDQVVTSAVPSFKEVSRESTRSMLSYIMIGILSVVVIFLGVIFCISEDVSKVKEFSGLVFTPIVTLLGPILGFYFGSETRRG